MVRDDVVAPVFSCPFIYSCGCFCVSTKVGGVPEVLPDRMIEFAEASPERLVDAIEIALVRCLAVDPFDFHAQLSQSYNWMVRVVYV